MHSSSSEGLEAMKMGQINALTFLRLFCVTGCCGGPLSGGGGAAGASAGRVIRLITHKIMEGVPSLPTPESSESRVPSPDSSESSDSPPRAPLNFIKYVQEYGSKIRIRDRFRDQSHVYRKEILSSHRSEFDQSTLTVTFSH